MKMDSIIVEKFRYAKNNNDINLMKKLYEENSDNLPIKSAYAKMLLKSSNKFESKLILEQLLNTKDRNHSLLQLGKIEMKDGNIDKARNYFKQLLKVSSNDYVLFELGKLESKCGNFDIAKDYFRKLLNTSNQSNALLELRKLELKELKLGKYELKKLKSLELELKKLNLEYEDNEDYYISKKENIIGYARKYLKQILLDCKNSDDKIYLNNLLILCDIKDEKYLFALQSLDEMLKQELYVDPRSLFYICKKLDIPTSNYDDKVKCDFSFKQILDYNEGEAINHIVKRHINKNTDFNYSINIYDIVEKIKDKLTAKNEFIHLRFYDTYIIPYENIGVNGEDFLQIITVPNSKDIITMYPVNNKIVTSIYDDKYLKRKIKKF